MGAGAESMKKACGSRMNMKKGAEEGRDGGKGERRDIGEWGAAQAQLKSAGGGSTGISNFRRHRGTRHHTHDMSNARTGQASQRKGRKGRESGRDQPGKERLSERDAE